MAVEVGELSSRNLKLKPPIDLEKWKNRKRLDDEFNNTDTPVLKPLRSVKVAVEKEEAGNKVIKEVNLDSEIEKDFSYYSRTYGLEGNTPRTQSLQNLVNKMTAGTDLQTRVVIMNKGKECNAFVTPDGTIFISQSILNALGSMDEIGAVLAHEVGHLYLRTSEKQAQAGGFIKGVGIPWLHEGVSDTLAAQFGVKAGLNTFAFGLAIEKIAGASRGFEHQGGYMRSSQNVAQHTVKNYETSAKAVEPVPTMLLGQVRPTNLELIKESIDKCQVGHLKEDLSKLHPRDLKQAYSHYMYASDLDYMMRYDPGRLPSSIKPLEQFYQLFKERLIKAGFSEAQVFAWFSIDSQLAYPFNNLEDSITVAQVIREVSQQGDSSSKSHREAFFGKMSETIFERGKIVDSLGAFLQLLEKYLYDAESGARTIGRIPVSRNSILEILSKVSTLDSDYYEQSYLGKVLVSYIEDAFYKNVTEEKDELDVSQIVDFLDEAREMEIKMDGRVIDGIFDKLNKGFRNLREGSIEAQNYQKLCDILEDYFGQKGKNEQQPFTDITREIDTFFQRFLREGNHYRKAEEVSNLLKNLRATFKHQGLDDAVRERFIKYLSDQFDHWAGSTNFSIRRILEFVPGQDLTKDIDPEENAKLARLQMRMVLGIVLFKEDGEEFYKFLEEAIDSSGIDFSSFSKVGLVNLYSPLFLAFDKMFSRESVYIYNGESRNPYDSYLYLHVPADWEQIKNFERFTSISVISEMLARTEKEDLSSWGNLRTSAMALARRLDRNASVVANFTGRESVPAKATQREYLNIFSDSALALILFADYRQAFLELLGREIREEDLKPLYEVLTTVYPTEVSRDNFLRAIQKRFLLSKNSSLDDKFNYLLANLENLGPEAVLMVADQIATLTDYQIFREKLGNKLEAYLGGGSLLLKGLAIDLVTSFLSERFETVIQSAIDDPKASTEVSTGFAKLWFQYNFKLNSDDLVRYDRDRKRFITTKSRDLFRSIADIFTILKNLTYTQRLLTIHKSLADAEGALSTPEHRQKLAGLVTRALKLKPGFIYDTIQTICRIGEPRLISFPAANMLSPMLFRTLDVNNIDYAECLKYGSTYLDGYEGRPMEWFLWKDLLTVGDAREIASSTTRQLTIFGAKFIHQPNSYFYTAAQESDRIYREVHDGLEKQLLAEVNGQQNLAEEVDPTIEAIVKGVEISGALGVRALQLLHSY